MGRVGAAGDNAAMESFFSLLQKNVLDRRRWTTRDELRLRSSPGSRPPTTAAAGNAPSAASPRSSLRPSTGRTRGLTHRTQPSQPKPGQTQA